MSRFPLSRRSMLALTATAALGLSACDSGSNAPEPDVRSQRLLVAEQGQPTLHVLDLDSGTPVGQVALAGPVRAYMTSAGPGERYVALAPTNGPIQTLDAGIFRQNGEVVRQAPAMLPFSVPGENLVHLTRGGQIIAGFYDGTGEARFFDATTLGTGTPAVTTIATGRAHHGVAVAMGEMLLVTRPVDGPGLPDGVRVYRRDTGAMLMNPEATCPGLHGEAKGSNTVVAFGCTDGLLVVRPGGTSMTASASKVAYPAGVAAPLRSGTLHAHEGVAQLVAHIGGGGQNRGPALYDPATNAMRMLDVPGRSPYARGYRFSTDGRHFLALGLDGALHVYETAGWTLRGSVAGVATALAADPLPSGTLYPQVIATARFAYVSDPATNQIREVDLATREVVRTMALPFVPGVLAIAGED